MNPTKRAKLEAAGFRVGSVAEFLELTPEENALVEIRLAFSNHLRRKRTAQNLSQTKFAQRMKSSQSRVAKMEAGDSSVSLDLLFRALLEAGTTRDELSNLIAPRRRGTPTVLLLERKPRTYREPIRVSMRPTQRHKSRSTV